MNYLISEILPSRLEEVYRTGMIEAKHQLEEDMMKLETFGERLFWARKKYAKLKQVELRQKMEDDFGVDIGANYISELEKENAEKRPSFEVVRAMAGVCKVSLDFLAGFTTNHMPAQGEEVTPHYFSEEADTLATLVDTLHPDQRALVLGLARSLSAQPTNRERMQTGAEQMLDSIERKHGESVRAEVEKFLRDKGIFIDPAS